MCWKLPNNLQLVIIMVIPLNTSYLVVIDPALVVASLESPINANLVATTRWAPMRPRVYTFESPLRYCFLLEFHIFVLFKHFSIALTSTLVLVYGTRFIK